MLCAKSPLIPEKISINKQILAIMRHINVKKGIFVL
jgi:hypothetical protein